MQLLNFPYAEIKLFEPLHHAMIKTDINLIVSFSEKGVLNGLYAYIEQFFKSQFSI